jgi:hypothetical protein
MAEVEPSRPGGDLLLGRRPRKPRPHYRWNEAGLMTYWLISSCSTHGTLFGRYAILSDKQCGRSACTPSSRASIR